MHYCIRSRVLCQCVSWPPQARRCWLIVMSYLLYQCVYQCVSPPLQVRRCWFGLVSALCARRPLLVESAAGRLAPAVLHALQETDPAVVTDTWDATISLASTVKVSSVTTTTASD